MKHLFRFFLVALLIAVSLFAILCIDVSFDDEPALTADYCPTHGLLQVRAVLPESVRELENALWHLTDPLPPALTEPPRAVLRATLSLFADLREIYLRETAGCTAFS